MNSQRQLFFVFGALLLCFFSVLAGDADSSGLRFAKQPDSTVVVPGGEVVLECALNVTADSVQWRLNRVPLPDSISKDRGRLVFQMPFEKEEYEKKIGTYQCIALFGASALASKPAEVSVAHIVPPSDIRHTVTNTTYVGNMFYLRCPPPVSVPPAVVLFYKDGNALSLKSDENGGVMLRNVTVADSGTYTCMANNPFNNLTVPLPYSISLQVVVASQAWKVALQIPTFAKKTYSVPLKGAVTLDCPAAGWPLPQFNWSKYGGQLYMDRTFIQSGTLTISNLQNYDTGTYVCVASNGISSVKHIIALVVLEEPSVKMEAETKKIEEGGEFSGECFATGSPRPKITWLLNGQSVLDDGSIDVSDNYLTIPFVEKRHAGILQCFATNKVGTIYGLSMLHVMPKTKIVAPPPSNRPRGNKGRKQTKKKPRTRNENHHVVKMIPPSKPNVTRMNSNTVILTWEVPPGDSLPIQFFRVQSYDMNTTSWSTEEEDIEPHVRSAEVTNLKQGHVYKFRISAVYSNEDNKQGANSSHFLMRKETQSRKPPHVPVLVSVTSAGATSLNVEWEYPNTSNIQLEGFFIHHRSDSMAGTFEKQIVKDPHARSQVVTHLLPDSRYEVRIQSFNNAGGSAFSETLQGITGYITTVEPRSTVSPENEILDMEYTPESASSSSTTVLVGFSFLGFVILIFLLFLTCYFCRLCNSRTAASEQDSRKEAQAFSMTNVGKSVTNGNVHHAHQLLHGHRHSQRLHITSNPLDDTAEHYKVESVVEVASQNNNFSDSSRQRLRTNSLQDEDDELSMSSGSSDEDKPPVPPRQCV